jgi:hypothetical protein
MSMNRCKCVCALVLLCGSASIASSGHSPDPTPKGSVGPELTKEELVRRMRALEPWRNTTAYSRKGWDDLIALARIVQRTNPERVAAALDLFGKMPFHEQVKPDYQEESKPFLLMRVVFDLPESAPRSEYFSFKGWIHPSGSKLPEWINLSWPVSWRNGTPHLVAAYGGSLGQPYAASAEYRYLLKRYRMRDLGK